MIINFIEYFFLTLPDFYTENDKQKNIATINLPSKYNMIYNNDILFFTRWRK